jgi:hypothetical protein
VPIWDADHTALVWMRGKYNSQLNYDMDIVGLTAFGPLEGFILGDLNDDHVLNLVDFSTYISYMHTNLSGLSAAEAYARGDLNGDFKNDGHDFILFRGSYNDENGAGAFEAALGGVPEPGATGVLVVAGIVLNSGWRRRRVPLLAEPAVAPIFQGNSSVAAPRANCYFTRPGTYRT